MSAVTQINEASQRLVEAMLWGFGILALISMGALFLAVIGMRR